MLLNFCWCILVFVCLHFANIQATSWDVKVCYDVAYHSSVRITLNNDYKDLSYDSNQKCFYGNFELNSGDMPSFIKVDQNYGYKAHVENPDLPAKYVGNCSSACNYKKVNLEKWVRWNIAALFSEMNYFPDQFFKIKPDVIRYIKFRTNSRTSNTSFFLPKEMNTDSTIELSTIDHGKFWLDTIVTLKNMETSKIYSCLYLNYTSQIPFHECSLINDTVWKIELTSRQELIGDIKEVQMFVRVTGRETNISRSLMFKKLAYLPTFSAFTNIGNINIGEIEISFGNKNKYFDISKIVMTRILTGEEYGCANIDKTNSPEYSCKLLNSKDWVLKVISPEEHERNFTVEINQDGLSSSSRKLFWKHLAIYGDYYVKYFNLKTYEDSEITSLRFNFFDKSLRISEISLINNFTEYKFKTTGGSKTQDNLMPEFIPITKGKQDEEEKQEKIHSTKTIPIMGTVIGILFLIIIIFSIRCMMLRNRRSRSNASTLQDVDEDNCISMQNSTPVHISEPSRRLTSSQPNSLDVNEDTYCTIPEHPI
ncbi:uncharacterized protein LOC115217841 [Octopus sinensis]|uniref:Uncharacterized protein LOC115217841 n=1 Tax=Octopus sinensis TaxID=2607531 RepID=A0A7E6F7B4_9MOLL|nr:uncharacterized protein LOC115217841 [Octopus sinensis]